MCHLILMLPLLGLAAFWIWPVSIAAPVYAVVFVASGLMYHFLMRAIRLPVLTGAEGLLQSTGKVIDAEDGVLHILVHSEIWNAQSLEQLQAGDTVQIIGLNGLSLDVRKDPAARS
jgi:membrane protein implicated in regulation of membrane protease activity